MTVALLTALAFPAAPALNLGLDLRAEQQVGFLSAPAIGVLTEDAALAINPGVDLGVGNERTTFSIGYRPRLFFRETGPGDDVLLLHQGAATFAHDFSRRVRWETEATITAGSLDYTDSDVLAPVGVIDEVQTGAPDDLILDLTGTTAATRLTIRASRRWEWIPSADSGYLGYAGLAGDGPSQYWVAGRVEGRYAWGRRCSLGLEPGVRHDQFIDGPAFETASLPSHLRCSLGFGDLRGTAGVAAVIAREEATADPSVDNLRWFPIASVGYEGEVIDRRCTVGTDIGTAPSRDPIRQNLGARAFWRVAGGCRFNVVGVLLRARLSTPAPLQLTDNPVVPEQDQVLTSRLAVQYLGWNELVLEGGLRATGRDPPESFAVWDLGMFVALSYVNDFSLGNTSGLD